MIRKLKIILANAPINNGNRGCVALSMTALYLLDKVLSNAGISYEIYLPDSQWGDNSSHSIVVNDKVISYYDCFYTKGVGLRNKVSTSVKHLSEILLSKGRYENIFKHADYILDIGQGDSFADIYGSFRFCCIDRIHSIAQRYKKPYCILPQTIGPFSNSEIEKQAIDSIKKASVVMARDQQSMEYVRSAVPSVQISEYIDVAFFLPYNTIYQNSDYIHVGLNISGLLWNGGYTQENQFGLVCNYQNVVRQIIEYFLNNKNIKVHLISHVVERERCIENDYSVAYDLWREYKDDNLMLAPYALSPIEIKSYISGMDFFIGARMHATIAAFSSGVPVVPMAYSRKFNGLFEDTLKYNHIVDMKTKSDDEILPLIINDFSRRKELKEYISKQDKTIVHERGLLLENDLKKFLGIK